MKKTAFVTFTILAITLILLPKEKKIEQEIKVLRKVVKSKKNKKTENIILKENLEVKTLKKDTIDSKQESFKHLELDEVNQLIGDLDLEIESRDFVQKANEGSLSAEERATFEKLLSKRNKLFNQQVALLVKKAKALL